SRLSPVLLLERSVGLFLTHAAALRTRGGRDIGDAAMNVVPHASQWGELIRPDRVHGSLYKDPAIFEAELQNIWYRTWVYVGHESEVPNANDYVVKSIGPQSVIMTRDEQGKVNLLLNRCSHRGNQVCSYDKGNARSFTCPFHSWTFANDGRLVGYAFPDGYEG